MTEGAIRLGLHPDMTNSDYHNGPGVSKSHLDEIAPPNTPLNYWAKRIDPNRKEQVKTPALIMGDAIHKAVLEPDVFDENIIAQPDFDRRTTSGKRDYAQWLPAAVGKIVITQDQMEVVKAIRDRVHTHPVVKNLFRGGNAEQTFFARDAETGELIKCRTDYERLELDGMIVDIKTCEDASEEAFRRSIRTYRYDVQDPWYRHVITSAFDAEVVQNFVFVGIEKEWPHAMGVYWITDEDRAEGMALARRDLALIQECRADGHWPDHAFKPRQISIGRNPQRRPY